MPGVLIACNAAPPHSDPPRRLQMPIFVQIHIRDLARHRVPPVEAPAMRGDFDQRGKALLRFSTRANGP